MNNRHGRLLLPAGAVLGARELRALKMWGVTHVTVQVAAVEEVAAEPEPLPEEVEGRLTALFQHNDRSHPLMAALWAHAARRATNLRQGRDAD